MDIERESLPNIEGAISNLNIVQLNRESRLSEIVLLKQADQFQNDWDFSLGLLAEEEVVEQAFNEDRALLTSFLEEARILMQPHIASARDYLDNLERRKLQLEEFKRHKEAGRVTNEQFSRFTAQYQSFIEGPNLNVNLGSTIRLLQLYPDLVETSLQAPVEPEQPPVTPLEVTPETPAGRELKTDEEPEREALVDPRKIKEDPRMSRFLEHLPAPAKVLVEQFFESKNAGWIFTQIRNFHSDDEEERKGFMQSLVGLLFEQLGYLHLTQVYSDQNTFVLSPQEINELYRRIYPNRELKNLRGENLHFAIPGITQPDGLIIQETDDFLVVTGVVDYKLWVNRIPNGENYRKQLSNYRYPEFSNDFYRGEALKDNLFHGRIINKQRPEISVKPIAFNTGHEIVFCLPENSPIKFSEPEINIKYIPIDSRAFGYFVDLLIESIDEIEFKEPSSMEDEKVRRHREANQIYDITLPDGQLIQVRGAILAKTLNSLKNTGNHTLVSDQLVVVVYGEDHNQKRANMSLNVRRLNEQLGIYNWVIDQPVGPSQRAQGKKAIYTLKQNTESATQTDVDKGDEAKLEKANANITSIQTLLGRGVPVDPVHIQRVQEIAGRLGIPFELSRKEPELQEEFLRLTPEVKKVRVIEEEMFELPNGNTFLIKATRLVINIFKLILEGHVQRSPVQVSKLAKIIYHEEINDVNNDLDLVGAKARIFANLSAINRLLEKDKTGYFIKNLTSKSDSNKGIPSILDLLETEKEVSKSNNDNGQNNGIK